MLLLAAQMLHAQETPINPSLLKGGWPAFWINCPGVPQRAYGVYHFRKNFQLASRPSKFIIHASADNRYRLFVNGQPVCSGPARGDRYNWVFETVDIAPYLQAGSNTMAALVWNMAAWAPVAQVSDQTALTVQGDGAGEQVVNTNGTWKVMHDSAYHPCSTDNPARLRTYMVVGPGDSVTAQQYPWGWEQTSYDDARWQQAGTIAHPVTAGYGSDNIWTLVPRTIPLMEESQQRIATIRRSQGIRTNGDFLKGHHPLTIPAHAMVTLLLDQGFNTAAYPELSTSGGRGATVRLTYAEALFDSARHKGNRNEIDGKHIIGNYDVFVSDGGNNRTFRPLWFRTYRYMQLDIQTGAEPLVINDLYGMRTGYPFKMSASFASNDSTLKDIWDVGWRTARLCAGETYFDCPYYEQLQYEGDTRIQSLISLYMTGDDRLMRKAITDFYRSRVPEGLTQGRYPSSRLQVIPPFSLYWVSMLYDHWMHRGDDAFIAEFLHAADGVLYWYEKHIDNSMQMLGPMKWWNFVDWNTKFPGGTPDGADTGHSAVVTLQYTYTLQQAAALFAHFHWDRQAAHYRELAATLNAGTYRQCFDNGKNIMGDTPDKKGFSQHASIMGVLSHAIPSQQWPAVMDRVLHDSSLSQATFYYRFYLVRALKEAAMADMYYRELTPWRNMLKIGLTTFAENPEPTRSDCHAWSSSPNYDFLATICGIMPDAPGFSQVLIKPAMGELKEVKGSMPHPAGMVTVWLKRKNNSGVEGEVDLPANVSGRFVWNGREIALKGGKQKIDL